MIKISNIGNPNLSNVDFADEVWAIVRSDKNIPSWMQWVPELAPSWDLFNKYRQWRDTGYWNKYTFNKLYVPQFLKELSQAEDVMDVLLRLKYLDSLEKTVCLVCFCQEETLCHRSIIAGVLQGLGFNVDASDYTEYSDMLKAIAN